MLKQARGVAERIFGLAGQMPIQVLIRIKKGLLVRFTNNGVHQNGFQDLFSYTLRILSKEGPVYLESNDLSDKGIQAALHRIRAEVPAPEPIPALRQKNYPRVKEYFSFSLEKTPAMAGEAIGEAMMRIRRKQASANGYYSAYTRAFYLRDSSGLELFHPATAVRFGVTVTKGAGKGYLSFYHPDFRKLRVAPVVEEAMELAEEASRREMTVKPGSYECIFSPRAFLELVEPLRRHFDQRLSEDRKSVLSGSLGKKIFSESFTLKEDLSHPGQFGVPFDAEGAPKKKRVLVNRGVVKELLAEGHSTRGLLEHPFYPENLVIERGELSVRDMIRRIPRGIFINKIWYHTLVRESAMEVTGLATAGSLYIEKGRIQGRALHLRYHDTLFSILQSVIGTSREQILLKDGERGAALFPYLWVSRLKVV